jgi:hypothetical protein
MHLCLTAQLWGWVEGEEGIELYYRLPDLEAYELTVALPFSAEYSIAFVHLNTLKSDPYRRHR